MPIFQCPKCELLFAAQGELDWHMREEHRAPADPPAESIMRKPATEYDGARPASTQGGRDQPGRRARWWPPWRRSG